MALRSLTEDDKVDRLSDKLGVCREEALLYLRVYQWDLDAATEACRRKTVRTPSLTQLTVQPLSEAPRTQPLMTGSNHPPGPEEEQQRNQKKIDSFCEVAIGATVEDARFYLSRKNWHLHEALGDYFEQFLTTASQSSPQMFAGNDLRQGVLSTVPQPQFHNNFEGVMIRDSSSSRREDDTTETSEDEFRQKCIKQFVDMVPGTPLQAALNCLQIHNWDVDVALDFFTRNDHSRIEPEEEEVMLCSRCQVFEGTIQEIDLHLKSCNVDTRRISHGVRRGGVDEESSQRFQCATCQNVFSNKEALKWHAKMCEKISYEKIFHFFRRPRSDRRQRYLHFPRRPRSDRRQRYLHFPRRPRSATWRQRLQRIFNFQRRQRSAWWRQRFRRIFHFQRRRRTQRVVVEPEPEPEPEPDWSALQKRAQD